MQPTVLMGPSTPTTAARAFWQEYVCLVRAAHGPGATVCKLDAEIVSAATRALPAPITRPPVRRTRQLSGDSVGGDVDDVATGEDLGRLRVVETLKYPQRLPRHSSIDLRRPVVFLDVFKRADRRLDRQQSHGLAGYLRGRQVWVKRRAEQRRADAPQVVPVVEDHHQRNQQGHVRIVVDVTAGAKSQPDV